MYCLKFKLVFTNFQDVIKSLGEMGHITKVIKPHSAVTAIGRETNGTLTAACDARRGGSVDGY